MHLLSIIRIQHHATRVTFTRHNQPVCNIPRWPTIHSMWEAECRMHTATAQQYTQSNSKTMAIKTLTTQDTQP